MSLNLLPPAPDRDGRAGIFVFTTGRSEMVSEMMKRVKDDGVMFVELEFTDIFGVLK